MFHHQSLHPAHVQGVNFQTKAVSHAGSNLSAVCLLQLMAIKSGTSKSRDLNVL